MTSKRDLDELIHRMPLNALTFPVVVTDLKGAIQKVNTVLLKNLECPESRLLRRTITEFMKDSEEMQILLDTVQEKGKYSDVVVLDIPAGRQTSYWVDASILVEGKTPVGIFWSFKNLTDPDASESESLQSWLQSSHVSSLLLAIRNVNQVIVQEQDFNKMLEKTCSSLVEARGYIGCAIAFAIEEGDMIRPQAHAGEAQMKVSWSATTHGEGDAPDCVLDSITQGKVQLIDSASDCIECTYRVECGPEPFWTVTIPITDSENTIGILQVIVRRRKALDEQEIELLREIAADLSIAWSKHQSEQARRHAEDDLRRLNRELESLVQHRTQELREANNVLRERVKEQTCLYSVSRIVRAETQSELEWMRELLEPIRQGWQFPDITEVRIRHGKQSMMTEGFHETDWILKSDALIYPEEELELAVAYSEERPDEDHGPFLKEELSLIREVTNLIAHELSKEQMQREIKEREQLLGMAIEGAAIGIVATNLRGEVLDSNKSFCNLVGYQKEELLTMNLWELDAEENKSTGKTDIQALVNGMKERVSFETIFKRKDSGYVFVIVNASIVHDLKGKPHQIVIQVQDITKRTELEQNYEIIANSIPGGIVHVMDSNFRYLFSAGELLQSVGLSDEALRGKSVFEVLPEDFARIVTEQYGRVLNGNKVQFEGEYGNRTFLVRAVPIRNTANEVDQILVLSTDVTRQKKAEKELKELNETLERRIEERTIQLRESQELYRTMLEIIPVAVVVTDLNMQIVIVNRMALKIHGFDSHEEMIGRNRRELIAPEDQERVVRNNERIKEVGSLRNLEYDLLRRDGSRVPSLLNVSVLRDKKGKPIHFIVVARDMSELRRLQNELLRKERLAALGKLSGGIGHELRNPLASISNGVYFLRMAIDSHDEEVRETLNIIDKELNNAVDIIESLLSFARPEPPTRKKVEITDVLREVMDDIDIPDNITMQIEEKINKSTILADPVQLKSVFENIISNAIESISGEGKIDVKIRQTTTDEVAVSVADTGTGIAQDELEKIFEPLFTRKTKGIGLGLAIAKSMIEAHQGRIEASNNPNKGACFTVYLPLRKET